MYPLREPWAIKTLVLVPIAALILSFLWLTSTRSYPGNPRGASHESAISHGGIISHEEVATQKDHHKASPTSKYAFATFLSGFNGTDSENYFTAVRLLTYQLVHDPRTRAQDGTPFLVLVTKDVEQEKQDILRHDGATIISVDDVEREWIHPKWARWNGVMAKLNLWTLTEYEKIVFFDADTVILRPMDGIFTINSTELLDTLPTPISANATVPDLSISPPEKYMIAGIHDQWMEANKRPPENETFYEPDNYMNAGFMVLAPSKEMFDYYVAVLDQPDAFNVEYPEQNLLNFVHRADGRMPWQDLGTTWNAITQLNPSYDPNVRSLHHKWWVELDDQGDEQFVADALQRMKDMEGFVI